MEFRGSTSQNRRDEILAATPGEASDHAERRRFPRFELEAQVELCGGGETVSLSVLNLSTDGIYVTFAVNALPKLQIAELVTVRLYSEHDGTDPLEVTMNARVVRIDRSAMYPKHPNKKRSGAALKWLHDEPSVAEVFGRILERLRWQENLQEQTDEA